MDISKLFFSACKKGELAEVELLLERFPELVKAKDDDGLTPLHIVSYYYYDEKPEVQKKVATLLLNKGADIEAKTGDYPHRWTPLHWASDNGNTEMATFLLDRGADIEAKTGDDDYNRTPLHIASGSGDPGEDGETEMVTFLLVRGADPNATDQIGWTPLHSASRDGHTDVATLLLDGGANVKAEDHDRRKPEDLARSFGETEMADFLRDWKPKNP